MLDLSGYRIIEEHSDGRRRVWRAIDESSEQPVVIEALMGQAAGMDPTPSERARIYNACEVLSEITNEGVSRVLAVEPVEGGLALIREDCGGRTLVELTAAGSLPLSESLHIGTALARTLEALHDVPILHKNIQPGTILVNRGAGTVKLTGFEYASRLAWEAPETGERGLDRAAFSYLSPEQTGYLHRTLDARSDLYSLGAVLYELLTGRVPFISDDVGELVHMHVTEPPLSPSELVADVPPALSEIVLKLLSKSPEERYQTAAGVALDLEHCLARLHDRGEIGDFLPGRGDRSAKLRVSQSLYGRDRERELLGEALARVVEGSNELVLVSGDAGVGKSALLHELREPVVHAGGLFVAGKFERFKHEIPYSALAQAFEALIRTQLQEPDPVRRSQVSAGLREALGSNGRVLVEIIPSLAALLGPLSPVATLSPMAALYRFQRAFTQLTRFFAKPEHPLIIVLDDVHWVDAASLGLICNLVSDSDCHHILVIAAYRDTAVDVEHPLALVIDDMRAAGVRMTSVEIAPLSREDVGQMVCDTLLSLGTLPEAEDFARIDSLVEFVMERTDGNPLHLVHLIDALHRAGLFRYRGDDGGWTWDLAELMAAPFVQADVVELMSARMRQLPDDTRAHLRVAACLGSSFELGLLSAASERTPVEVARALMPALEDGLLLPLGDGYKLPLLLEPATFNELGDSSLGELAIRYRFVHDRAQRAAYYLADDPPAGEIHRQIGRYLDGALPPAARDRYLFTIASQLDLGRTALTDPGEHESVAEIELHAARRARSTGAHEIALAYTTAAMELLGDGSWFHNHELTLSLYTEAIADAQAVNNYERAGKLAEVALRYTEGPLERAAITARQIDSLIAQGRAEAAIENALHALQLLDVSLCLDPPQDLTPALLRAGLRAGRGASDSDKRAAIMPQNELADRILAAAWAALPAMGHETVAPVLYTRLHLAVTGASPAVMAEIALQYAVLLCGPNQEATAGREFGEFALQLIDEHGLDEMRPAAVQAYHSCILPWTAALRESLEPIRSAIRLGLDHGDPTTAGRAALDHCIQLLGAGEVLSSVHEQCLEHQTLAKKLQLDDYTAAFEILIGLVRELMSDEPKRGRDSRRSERRTAWHVQLDEIKQSGAVRLLFGAHTHALMRAYLFDDITAALEHAREAVRFRAGALGRFITAEHNCFHSLAMLAACQGNTAAERNELLSQVAINQQSMECWAKQAPENFQYRYELIAAEEARVTGQYEVAGSLYERAVRSAAEYGATLFEGLAMERMAVLQRSLRATAAAEECVRDAQNVYRGWGATAKAQQLEDQPHVDWNDGWNNAPVTVVEDPDLSMTTPHMLPVVRVDRGIAQETAQGSDLDALMAACQAIARELDDEMVLARTIDALIAYSGAPRGLITLLEDGYLVNAAFWEGHDIRVERDVIADVPPEFLRRVLETRAPLVLDDACSEGEFRGLAYVVEELPRSILCMPVEDNDECIGVIYLEDREHIGLFDADRVEATRHLSTQLAISLINSYAVASRLAAAHEEAKREREAQNREAWALAKLTIDKENFLSLMAHDLKNALNQIVGVADFLVCEFEEYDPEEFDLEDTNDLLGKLLRVSEATAELLINFLTWRKLQSGGMAVKKEDRNLFMLAKKTLTLVEDAADRKQITMKNAISRDVFVHVDPNMTDAVIRNLVGNALKFTPPKGSVTVSVEPHTELSPEGLPMMVISVSDTGVGIKEEDIDKLFRSDVNHTTTGTANEKGSGFGLAMCQDMVELNGGTIWVESEFGKGTKFCFTVQAGEKPS